LFLAFTYIDLINKIYIVSATSCASDAINIARAFAVIKRVTN